MQKTVFIIAIVSLLTLFSVQAFAHNPAGTPTNNVNGAPPYFRPGWNMPMDGQHPMGYGMFMMRPHMGQIMMAPMGGAPNQITFDSITAPISKDEALEIGRRYVLMTRNSRIQVGEIKELDENFEVPIVTRKEKALVDVLYIDKKTGFTWND